MISGSPHLTTQIVANGQAYNNRISYILMHTIGYNTVLVYGL